MLFQQEQEAEVILSQLSPVFTNFGLKTPVKLSLGRKVTYLASSNLASIFLQNWLEQWQINQFSQFSQITIYFSFLFFFEFFIKIIFFILHTNSSSFSPPFPTSPTPLPIHSSEKVRPPLRRFYLAINFFLVSFHSKISIILGGSHQL